MGSKEVSRFEIIQQVQTKQISRIEAPNYTTQVALLVMQPKSSDIAHTLPSAS